MPEKVSENTLSLADIKKGQVWMVEDPVRVAQIGQKTKVQVIVGKDRDRHMETRDAVEVLVTIADKPIDGFVTARSALGGSRIKQSLVVSSEEETVDERLWMEIWTERVVPDLLRNKAGGALYRNDDAGPFHTELYCHDVKGRSWRSEGRPGARAGSSRITGKRVFGTLIPKEAVPAGLFDVEPVEVPTEVAAEAPTK